MAAYRRVDYCELTVCTLGSISSGPNGEALEAFTFLYACTLNSCVHMMTEFFLNVSSSAATVEGQHIESTMRLIVKIL